MAVSAVIETEHEARIFGGAAMQDRVDAQRAVMTVEFRGDRVSNGKPGRHINDP
ncbi:MAG: hypothetical protein A49_25210 [Methyloceanibacter sp.]|nr:MAG: hypothetical protein A49_25210 [Methyloceanibacter sp.]